MPRREQIKDYFRAVGRAIVGKDPTYRADYLKQVVEVNALQEKMDEQRANYIKLTESLHSGQARWAEKYTALCRTLDMKLAELEVCVIRLAGANKTIEELQGKLAESNEAIDGWQDELEEANKTIEGLRDDLTKTLDLLQKANNEKAQMQVTLATVLRGTDSDENVNHE